MRIAVASDLVEISAVSTDASHLAVAYGRIVTSEAFALEADMAGVLLPRLRRLVGRRRGEVEVFFEVPAVRGVPDVIAVQFVQTALDGRQAAIIEQSDIVTLLALTDLARSGRSIVGTRELADQIGMSPSYVSGATLLRLAEKGFVVPAARATWRLAKPYILPVRTLVTIELKIRDWAGGLNQASLHGQGADASWVVLDAARLGVDSRIADTARAAFVQRGVGLSVIGSNGRLAVWENAQVGGPRSYKPFMAKVAKAVLAERVFELWLNGRRSGPDWPVFGRPLHPNKATDRMRSSAIELVNSS